MTEKEDELRVLQFINGVLRKTCESYEYVEFLQGGSILLELIRAISPTPIGQKKSLSSTPSKNEIVDKVIYELFEFGIPPHKLFEPRDLLEKNNITKVRII